MIFNEDFQRILISSLLWFHSGITDTNVSGKLFEELCCNALVGAGGKDVIWNCGGKQQGYDVISDSVRISCKGGQFKNRRFSSEKPKEKYLEISSYRLGKHQSLQEKIEFLSQKHEDIILGLTNTHKNKSNTHRYILHSLLRDSLDYETIQWQTQKTKTNRTNYYGFSQNGIQARIIESMSHQLWFYVPVKYVTIHFDISISCDRTDMYRDNKVNDTIWIG